MRGCARVSSERRSTSRSRTTSRAVWGFSSTPPAVPSTRFSPQYFVEANGLCMAPDYAYLPQNPAAQALFANPGNRTVERPVRRADRSSTAS